MRLALPKGAKVRRGQDIDYHTAAVRYGGAWLSTGVGPHWSAGLPQESEMLGLAALVERDVVTPWGDVAAEYRGVRTSGVRWRFLGMFGATIEYETADTSAAAYFDRIIDSLCWTHS